MTEFAFLLAILAWEAFLEETFVLYLLGQRPPRGRPPYRYSFPPNISFAKDWVLPERGRYAVWNDAGAVRVRAERFFRDGRPFAPVLSSIQNLLEEANTIRNAVVHSSKNARQKFETLAQTKLGRLPPRLSVGGFLGMTMPRSTPPSSFLDFYVSKIVFAAKQIVPTP